MRTAIGRSEDVARFLRGVLSAANVPLQSKGKAVTVHLSNESPRALAPGHRTRRTLHRALRSAARRRRCVSRPDQPNRRRPRELDARSGARPCCARREACRIPLWRGFHVGCEHALDAPRGALPLPPADRWRRRRRPFCARRSCRLRAPDRRTLRSGCRPRKVRRCWPPRQSEILFRPPSTSSLRC